MPWSKGKLYSSGAIQFPTNGSQAINERIKELDFKDTKVRVTNVDSQGSDANIVIQVIGEISNQGQPHKRFAQTFVLAEQTNGYFVLNDIFRYLAEEPEEVEELQQESSAPANGVLEPTHSAAVPETEANTKTDTAEDLNKVDDKLAEAQQESATEDSTVAQQTPAEVEAPVADEAPAAVAEEAAVEPEAVKELEPEKPKEPAPTPAASKPAPVAMPSGPPKPAAPRTWASLAASANKVATPVIPAPAAQQQPKSTTATQPTAAPAPAQAAAPARDQSPSANQGEATGWQTASHKKEQSRAQNQGPTPDADQKRAYIKNVYSQVEEGALRALLTKFGEIEYLDISRPKVSDATT